MSLKHEISLGEGEKMCFQAQLDWDEMGKALSSFLNTNGGTLLIGVDKSGEIVQGPNDEQQKRSIEEYLLQSILPQAAFSVVVEDTKNGVISAKVWAGSKPPYVFGGKIYVRKGLETTLATPDDISSLILKRQRADLHWERQSVLGIDWEDLDITLIRATMQKAVQKVSGSVSWQDEDSFLTHYGLYQSGNFTHAAVLLFAKNPTRWLPQCRVRMVEMPEGKTGSRYSSDHLLEGNLFEVREKLHQWLLEKFPVESHFNPDEWERKEARKYPMEAVDEGVMNALIHRDFSNVSGSVLIELYPEQLRILNYGGLPAGWNPQMLKKNHLSVPRNPDIAHIFYLTGWIEKLGRGTLLILERCKEYGLKQPEWQDSGSTTSLTFFAKPRPFSSKVTLETLNMRQQKILEVLENGLPQTVAQLLQGLSNQVSDRTVRTDLQLLIAGGWAVKQGSGPHTRYALKPTSR